jgi:hypothetical protein
MTIGHAHTIAVTADWTDEDFDDYRPKMTTCGASEVFDVLFGARLELALTHKGKVDRFTGNDVTALGRLAEPYALRWLSSYLERPVQSAQCILRHPTHPELHCTPDGLCVTDSGVCGGESKWTPASNRESVELLMEYGPQAVIDRYAFRAWLQACHSLAVTGLDVWYVCWMVGGQAGMRALAGLEPVDGDFYVFPVRRDDEDVASMVALIEREVPVFWRRYVLGDELPDPNPNAPGDLRAIGKAYRVAEGLEVDAPELSGACVAYVSSRESEREFKAIKDEARAEILATMGEAQVASVPGFSVKRGKRGQLLVKERE